MWDWKTLTVTKHRRQRIIEMCPLPDWLELKQQGSNCQYKVVKKEDGVIPRITAGSSKEGRGCTLKRPGETAEEDLPSTPRAVNVRNLSHFTEKNHQLHVKGRRGTIYKQNVHNAARSASNEEKTAKMKEIDARRKEKLSIEEKMWYDGLVWGYEKQRCLTRGNNVKVDIADTECRHCLSVYFQKDFMKFQRTMSKS